MATKKELQAKSASQAASLSKQVGAKGYDGTARKTATRLLETNRALTKMGKATMRQKATKAKGKKLTSQDTRTSSSIGRAAKNATNTAGLIQKTKANSSAVKGARATLKRTLSNKNAKIVTKSGSKPTILSTKVGQSYKTRSGKTYTPKQNRNWKSRRALITGTIIGKAENYKVPKSVTRSQGGISKGKLGNLSKIVGKRRAGA